MRTLSYHGCTTLLGLALLNACGSGTSLFGDGEATSEAPALATGGTRSGATGSDRGSQRIGAAGTPSGLPGGAATGGTSARLTSVAAGGAGVIASAGASYTAADLDRDTARCGDPPWILDGLVRNSRDLGGVPIEGGWVVCDRLYRGSQFYGMAPKGCAEVAALGIRTIIDLRTDSERSSYTAPECMSTSGAQFVNAPMPTPYGVTPEAYIDDLEQPAVLRAIFDVLDDEASYPVYFHCIYGRDRTGVLAALVLRLLGAPRDVVMTEYNRSVQGGAGATPPSLEATLDRLEALGGAEAYLLSLGISAESIAAVKRILTSSG